MTWTWRDDDPATAASAQNLQTHVEMRLRSLELAGGGGGASVTVVADAASLPAVGDAPGAFAYTEDYDTLWVWGQQATYPDYSWEQLATFRPNETPLTLATDYEEAGQTPGFSRSGGRCFLGGAVRKPAGVDADTAWVTGLPTGQGTSYHPVLLATSGAVTPGLAQITTGGEMYVYADGTTFDPLPIGDTITLYVDAINYRLA